jgi:hypothetical protein
MPGVLDSILSRLDDARRRDYGVRALRGLLLSVAAILVLALLSVGVEALAWLGVTWRTIVVVTGTCSGVGIILWFAGVPFARRLGLLKPESDLDTARRVGRVYPEIHDRLMNAVQLAQQPDAAADYYSADFLDAALQDTARDVTPLDFAGIIDHRPIRKAVRILAGTVVLILVLILSLPGELGPAFQRCVHFRQAFTRPLPFALFVEPGSRDVVKGESVDIRVRVDGTSRDPLQLLLVPEGQVTTDVHPLELWPDGMYRYRLDNLRLSTSYRVRSGEVETEEYQLMVLDRPAIVSLQLRLQYPHYTGLSSRDLDQNVGDVTAPVGTVVRFSLASTKPIAGAAILFSDSTRVDLAQTGTHAEGSVVVRNDRTYTIRILDSEGLPNTDPIEYSIHAIPDVTPAIAIVAPGMDLNIAGNERLPMVFRVTDDYGVSRLQLAHRLIHSRYEPPARDFTYVNIPIQVTAGTEWTFPFAWDLSILHLSPEDVVEYHADVFDNDAVTGPKSASSSSFTLRLPSLDEVFADADKKHEASAMDLEKALAQAEEARKDLEELSREMKKQQQKLNWDEQKKAEELARRYQDIQEKVEQVQRTVDSMVEQMQKNRVISPETLEKYQELQHLMEQISSPEFAEAMKKLQQSMQQMSPEALKQALQQFQFSEEQFRKSIERTLNLLKRIQVEQKVDEMLKRTEAMEKAQDDLRKSLDQSLQPDTQTAADNMREQQDLRDQASALERELKALEKRMEEFPAEMPVKQMQDLQSSLEKSEMESAMQQSIEKMQQGEFQQAMQQQQKSLRALSGLKQDLQSIKQMMMQNQQRQVVQEMQRATRDLIELSKREESLKNEVRSLDPSSQRFRENAQQQMNAQRDLENVAGRLGDLSQKTFSISPEMGKSIGEAMREMQQALQSLEQRNGMQAGQHQEGAMGALNQTAQQLQSAIQGMMQGGGQGMGMAGLMQQLQRLSGMQQGINSATQGLTPEQAADMARLAGEQGMVRKSLEELAREATRSGDMSRLLGDLNRVTQDMREVQTDLAQGNVNPETVHKQERILSRMLDAQRSMRERDYEKRRKAESGTNVARRGPETLDLSTQEGRSKLQQDLLRALEEGYSKDYETLIRKYFDALQK